MRLTPDFEAGMRGGSSVFIGSLGFEDRARAPGGKVFGCVAGQLYVPPAE